MKYVVTIKECFLNNVTFMNVARWWLTGILIILPFHFTIFKIIKSWNNELSILFNLIDEGTLVIFLPLAIREFYKNRELSNWSYIILLFSILIFSISGFISGMFNENSLLITIHGIFHYIKHFLIIFIYAAFIRDFNEFEKIFRLLLVAAVFVGFVAFIEEVWAMYFRYFFDKDINQKGIVIFINKILGVSNISSSSHRWRLGIYRASLLFHYNLIGIYSLFILTFYLNTKKKLNFAILFSLLTGVFASVSRTAYTGFVLLAGLQIFKGRKWFMIFLIPTLLVLFLMFFSSSLGDFNMSQLMGEEYNKKNAAIQHMNVESYREYARQKAVKVWKDHPVWGVGPGMFGGAVAYKYRSPFYEEYNFSIILRQFHSLEQLWPQALAEMGIVGTTALAGLFVSLLAIFIILRQRANFDEIRGLNTGLITFTLIFLIYTSSGNLNIVPLLFPFCAFAGMGLGCMVQSDLSKANEIRREE